MRPSSRTLPFWAKKSSMGLRRRRQQQAGAQRAAGSARLGQAASHQAFPHIRLLVSGLFFWIPKASLSRP